MRHATRSFGVIVVEEQRLAVRRGREDARIGIVEVKLEFLELHVTSNVGAQRPNAVRERGGAEAWMKFLGDRSAPDHFAAFENERLEAALGKVEGSDESVVTRADDNYALSDGHGQF